MRSALLKFRGTGKQHLDPNVLAAAVGASPEPMALAENGKLIYRNHSFAQLSSAEDDGSGRMRAVTGESWRSTEFVAAGRSFSLTTIRHEAALAAPDSQHFAIIGRLVGGVAHDFNNLLTGILLYCDLLRSTESLGNRLLRRIDDIRSAAEHGAALIRQLMSLGREENGAPRTTSFNHVVREVEPLLRHLLGEPINIVIRLADDSGQVGISMAQAQQIILNLALNARDAMPAGGRLQMESCFRRCEGTSREGRIFEFTVSDSGEGMLPQTAARIFDPFFTTKAPDRGTGLGLATVRRIVEEAGGIICVDTTQGKGTRMTVRLPQVYDKSGENQAIRLAARSEKTNSENRGASL